MSACSAENGGQLIPGLPEDLVISRVVSRLPWHTRPVCRALSKSWRTVLDTKNPELDLQTRKIQVPLLRGLFLIRTHDRQVFIRDDDVQEPHRINGYQIQPHWRKLPPLTGPDPFWKVLARSGMVYVWLCDDGIPDGAKSILKLDMGCAGWTWKKIPVPYAFNYVAVSFNDKIYVPYKRSFRHPKSVVLMHDMTTDMCSPVETWHRADGIDDLTVVSDVGFEEMCRVRITQAGPGIRKLKVLIYDGQSDSWKTWERLLVSGSAWLGSFQLVNNDCFEPASEMGINIVWWCRALDLLHWYNPSAGGNWVDLSYIPSLQGRRVMEDVQFERGSMYGYVCDKQEHKKDTGTDEKGGRLSGLFKRTLMKGKINVESSSVVWEEVLEMGFFQAPKFGSSTYDTPNIPVRVIVMA